MATCAGTGHDALRNLEKGVTMASVYRSGKQWYGSYTGGGKRRQIKLDTTKERKSLEWKATVEAAQKMQRNELLNRKIFDTTACS